MRTKNQKEHKQKTEQTKNSTNIKGMNQKEHEPKRAQTKKSANQKPKRARTKNSTNQKQHEHKGHKQSYRDQVLQTLTLYCGTHI